MDFQEITNQAEKAGELAVLSSHGARRITHILPMPTGLCPRSGNPTGGELTLSYSSPMAVEVVSLHQYLRTPKAARSSEGWALEVASAVASAVRRTVTYKMDITLNPDQRLVVEGQVG